MRCHKAVETLGEHQRSFVVVRSGVEGSHRAPFSGSTCFCQYAKNMFTDVAVILSVTLSACSAAGKG